MKINIFYQYYNNKDQERQSEIDRCFLGNAKNKFVDNMIVINHGRPTYNEIFKLTEPYPNDINIIINSDVYFDETLRLIKEFDWSKYPKTCFALSRWDFIPASNFNGMYRPNRIEHWNHCDSQDSWVVYGSIKQIQGADFTLGIAGNDNSICYLLDKAGYNVFNPSKTIKTVHVHVTTVRSYVNEEGQVIERIPPPYKQIHPTTWEEMLNQL